MKRVSSRLAILSIIVIYYINFIYEFLIEERTKNFLNMINKMKNIHQNRAMPKRSNLKESTDNLKIILFPTMTLRE